MVIFHIWCIARDAGVLCGHQRPQASIKAEYAYKLGVDHICPACRNIHLTHLRIAGPPIAEPLEYSMPEGEFETAT